MKTFPTYLEAMKDSLDRGERVALHDKDVRRHGIDTQATAIALGCVVQYDSDQKVYLFEKAN